ncbi:MULTISPECIES: type II secretion system F family protein [Brevundimonas]|jgi:tight adherence protein B|uniref:Tight adherence protein B n=1 Tax=Brevundimonas halotolerans TaxID=69670 RepID=A0A7W9A3H8_9CAUL|nr:MULTISPECIES: type II secretion system F family protein [Brevundimonas]MAL88391.1 secretion protein F [Brevundimonas sp.]MBB5660777.1 tight adherence protein B [Brevundimonas halotolerans]HAJ04081.1 secretion protein F [Brevundimonas sp.]HAV51097.1 secretion protein F [Brevundimonas sp.]|tara:strand:- start:8649 stop:9626 length:978 start_codon:yes stop_codon:yes gene_type:complete
MLALLAAVLAFITIGSVGWVLVGGDDSSAQAVKRAQTFGGPKVDNGRLKKTAAANTPEARRKQIVDQLQEADRADRKARMSLKARIRHAGLSLNVRTFWIISGGLGVTALLMALMFGLNILLGLGLALVFGLGLPRWVLSFLAKGRMKKFSSQFADAVDVIVRGIKSGLPVHDCFKIIGRESPSPLGPEFQKLVEGLGVGLTLSEALNKMYERMPTPELKFFSIVMAIQQKTGGNLAEALTNLSTVLRARRMMGEKIKALSSEATASAGIIGSLPPAVMILVTLTTPAYMMILFTDPRGQFMLLVAVAMMSLGIFVMKKMISFKF